MAARKLRCGRHVFDLARPLVMGVVNVTPDSFSDGGRFLDLAQAEDHARQMIADGADLIDIGGESTRPRADPVAEADEIARVIPLDRDPRPATASRCRSTPASRA
jgi:dihydropteroate synthase